MLRDEIAKILYEFEEMKDASPDGFIDAILALPQIAEWKEKAEKWDAHEKYTETTAHVPLNVIEDLMNSEGALTNLKAVSHNAIVRLDMARKGEAGWDRAWEKLNELRELIGDPVKIWTQREQEVINKSTHLDLLMDRMMVSSFERKHILYETGDKDAPDAIKDRNGEVVLGLCRICLKGESELSEQCHEVKHTRPATPEEVRELIEELTKNHDEGKWIKYKDSWGFKLSNGAILRLDSSPKQG